MKTQIKSIIFAVAFGSVCSSNLVAAHVNNDSAKNKTAIVTIANSNQKNFENFVNQKFSTFVKEEDWKKITKIVTLYNQSPSQLLKTNAAERTAFENAAAKLNNELQANGSVEAQEWSKNLNSTVRIIKFIWNNDWNIAEPTTETSNVI